MLMPWVVNKSFMRVRWGRSWRGAYWEGPEGTGWVVGPLHVLLWGGPGAEAFVGTYWAACGNDFTKSNLSSSFVVFSSPRCLCLPHFKNLKLILLFHQINPSWIQAPNFRRRVYNLEAEVFPNIVCNRKSQDRPYHIQTLNSVWE